MVLFARCVPFKFWILKRRVGRRMKYCIANNTYRHIYRCVTWIHAICCLFVLFIENHTLSLTKSLFAGKGLKSLFNRQPNYWTSSGGIHVLRILHFYLDEESIVYAFHCCCLIYMWNTRCSNIPDLSNVLGLHQRLSGEPVIVYCLHNSGRVLHSGFNSCLVYLTNYENIFVFPLISQWTV